MNNGILNKIDFDKKVFVDYLRFIVGAYFIYASLDKIQDPYSFARTIESYQFSSSLGLSFLDTFLALILPWLEFFVGAFLIAGIFIDEVVNTIILLLCFFLVMICDKIGLKFLLLFIIQWSSEYFLYCIYLSFILNI
mgnify:CR=1 FL=1